MKGTSRKYNALTGWINAFMLIVFLFSVFGNLFCPLLWNDEAHTVMNARFTATYGYPKITDGKNIVYAYQVNSDGSYERYNDNIQASNLPIWGGYYWSLPPYWLAECFEGLWTKTLIFRLWFAMTGLVGLWLIVKTAFVFLEPSRRRFFIFGFLLFCTLNISLGLHLREVRYYSLMLLLSGTALFLFARLYFEWHEKRNWLRAGLAISLSLMFYTFHPLYFIFLGFMGVWLFTAMLRAAKSQKGKPLVEIFKREMLRFSPLLLSLVLVVPSFEFFMPFAEAGQNVPMRKNLAEVIGFMAKHDFIVLGVGLKIVFTGFLLYAAVKKDFYNIVDYRKITGSIFIALAFLVYLLVIARIPENTHVFTRYYLVLFPLLYMSLLFDGFLIFDWSNRLNLPSPKFFGGVLLGVLIYFSNPLYKISLLEERIYELTHCYKGPLDYVIPFIKEKYGSESSKLVIATNYEETAFMYYLDSKTTIGFLGNNMAKDTLIVPDIIVYRKHWDKFEEIFKTFLKTNNYDRISFPVRDIPINNLPQLDYRISHRFRTPIADGEEEKLEVYILNKN